MELAPNYPKNKCSVLSYMGRWLGIQLTVQLLGNKIIIQMTMTNTCAVSFCWPLASSKRFIQVSERARPIKFNSNKISIPNQGFKN